jgi:hypothetical protein
MRNIVFSGLFLFLFSLTSLVYGASLNNTGFETGSLSSWTLTGNGSVVTSFIADNGITGYQGPTYGPVEGTYFARIYGSSSLRQTFTINAGETIYGYATFDSRDYTPYNDYAGVYILNSSGSQIANPWYRDVASVGNYGESPWSEWSWTATTGGSYTLRLRVSNVLDSEKNSYALFDAKASAGVVPEPASMALLGIGLAGMAAGLRKNKK